MSDKYEEYDFEEVQGRAGRKGKSKTEVSKIMIIDIIILSKKWMSL